MKKNRIITSVLAMALVLIAVMIVVITVGLFKTTEETLEGQAETTDHRLSSKVPSRVLELRVAAFVHKGDTLVVLEAPDVEAKLSQATAAYDAAKAMENKVYSGARQEDTTRIRDVAEVYSSRRCYPQDLQPRAAPL